MPKEGKTVTAAQVKPVMGRINEQGWWLGDQHRPASLFLKPVMESSSHPQKFVEEKWLPITSKE